MTDKKNELINHLLKDLDYYSEKQDFVKLMKIICKFTNQVWIQDLLINAQAYSGPYDKDIIEVLEKFIKKNKKRYEKRYTTKDYDLYTYAEKLTLFIKSPTNSIKDTLDHLNLSENDIEIIKYNNFHKNSINGIIMEEGDKVQITLHRKK